MVAFFGGSHQTPLYPMADTKKVIPGARRIHQRLEL